MTNYMSPHKFVLSFASIITNERTKGTNGTKSNERAIDLKYLQILKVTWFLIHILWSCRVYAYNLLKFLRIITDNTDNCITGVTE